MGGNKRRAKTVFSIGDMFWYVREENPTDKIYVNDETVDSLTEFLAVIDRAEPGGKNITIDPDILFAGLMRFRDCEVIWCSDDNKAGSCFRVVMFPEYMDMLNKAGDSVVVFGFLYAGKLVIPLGVQKNDKAISFGRAFFEDGMTDGFIDTVLTQNGVSFKRVIVGIMAVWYALEIAAVDPITRDLFNDPFPDFGPEPIPCYAIRGNDIYARINELKGDHNNG